MWKKETRTMWYPRKAGSRRLEKGGEGQGGDTSEGSDGSLEFGHGNSTGLGTTKDAVRSGAQSTGGLNLAVHEVVTAFLRDGSEEVGLGAEELALVETRSVGKVGFVLDVGVQDIPGAGRAEIGGGGAEEKEGDVVGGEGAGVGNDIVAALGVEGRLETVGGGACDRGCVGSTPVSGVVLRADGRAHGRKNVQRIVDANDSVVDLGGQFFRASSVEGGDL